jgi:uncharacterized membrane protein YfcA
VSEIELVALAAAALVSATMSGVVGFGGGVVLLGVLLLFLPPLEAIPVHGAIQIFSNSTRGYTLRAHIDRSILKYHLVLLIPGSLLGLAVAASVPVDLGRALIGVFALVATWRPRWITPQLERPLPARSFLGVGALQGFVNLPLGATGPLVTPFFKISTSTRHAFVATFAATQTAGHLVKVGVFGLDDFNFGSQVPAILVGAVSVVIGTMIGTRLLGRVSEEVFRRVFLTAITIISLRLIINAAL